VRIVRSPSTVLCSSLALLCCAVPIVSLVGSAEAGSAVTRVEIHWSWTSGQSGGPPVLRALAGQEAATAGCWPKGTVVLGPCPEIANAGWEGRDPDSQGNPRTIAYVDRSPDQRRRFEFEAYLPCVPPCGELKVWATITNADGSTKRVPPFTLGQADPRRPGSYSGSKSFVSAGRTGAQEGGKKGTADRRFFGAKTVVTGGVGDGNSDDPSVRLRVARNRRTVDVLGPHDNCNHGSGGFNTFEYFYAKVDDVKIKPNRTFQGSSNYVQEYDSAYHHYEFSFKVTVKGRFVSPDTAKGTLSWQMTVGGSRNQGGPSPCPPLKTKFTAKRGKVVGEKAVKMPSRTKWHPEGQVP
jgi:hypothetical protein